MPCGRSIRSIVSDSGACRSVSCPNPGAPAADGGGGHSAGLPAGGGGPVGAGSGAGTVCPWNGICGGCTVTVCDCGAGAPPSAASCVPQLPQNRVPGSIEYPQDGHQPSIPAIMSLSGIPDRLTLHAGTRHQKGKTDAAHAAPEPVREI